MDLVLSDDPDDVDLAVVKDYLCTQAYWGRWRDAADVERQVRGAWRVVSAWMGSEMVGFARAVSDGVDFAYLADVFVLPAWQGRGIGEALVRRMVDGSEGSAFRWVLHTADAHGLYRKLGFREPDQTVLERPSRR